MLRYQSAVLSFDIARLRLFLPNNALLALKVISIIEIDTAHIDSTVHLI